MVQNKPRGEIYHAEVGELNLFEHIRNNVVLVPLHFGIVNINGDERSDKRQRQDDVTEIFWRHGYVALVKIMFMLSCLQTFDSNRCDKTSRKNEENDLNLEKHHTSTII